jgi:phage portal protein BeeE
LFRTAKYFVKYDVAGLLRADDAGRAAYYRQAIGGSQGPGWLAVNEIRRKENVMPVEGHDELYDPNKANKNAKLPEAPPAGD